MDKYRKVIKKREQEEKPENEIRLTAQGSVSAYVSRAAKVFGELGEKKIVITATGNALTKAVTLCEVAKRRFKGLHQSTKIGNQEIVDEYEPIEEGLDKVETKRNIPFIEITLSKEALDTGAVGYQAPLPDEMVTELSDEEIEKSRGRGRGGGRGKGRGKGKGKGKGKGESKGKSKGKGKGESKGKGKGKGKGKEAPAKGKGKGKGKDSGKGKGKGKGKEAPSSKGKGKGKGKEAPSKGKGKDAKGKGKDKGKSKGKGKDSGWGSPSKGKGYSKGNDWSYSSSSYNKGSKGKGKGKGKGWY